MGWGSPWPKGWLLTLPRSLSFPSGSQTHAWLTDTSHQSVHTELHTYCRLPDPKHPLASKAKLSVSPNSSYSPLPAHPQPSWIWAPASLAHRSAAPLVPRSAIHSATKGWKSESGQASERHKNSNSFPRCLPTGGRPGAPCPLQQLLWRCVPIVPARPLLSPLHLTVCGSAGPAGAGCKWCQLACAE